MVCLQAEIRFLWYYLHLRKGLFPELQGTCNFKMSVLEILFWFFTAAVFYTYLGYPVLLTAAVRFFSRPVQKGHFEPHVSIVISAFNEERFILRKIENLLQSDYPREKFEIIVGSDGGSDKTDDLVSGHPDERVKFFRFVQNMGKPHVLNGLVAEATGSIIVFTDSRQRFERNTIKELVDNFADPEVGCVSGELYFEEVAESGVAKGMDAYWKYEKYLRRQESAIGSMLGATGAIYAIRRRLFEPVPTDILVDDMYIPLNIIRKGYRAVFDGQARAFDLVSSRGGQEFTRKVRTLAGNFQIFKSFKDLMMPFRSPVAWQLISHKLMRLLIPHFLICLFGINLLLFRELFYGCLLAGQVLFYGAAAFEWFWQKSGRSGKTAGYIPYMFCLLNISAFAGFVRYLKGADQKTWKKVY